MPVPSNISGLSYNDDIEFNDEELEGLKLFNGYPINTQTFPSASRYIWTFYSGSSIELLEGDPNLHFDHTQSFQLSSNLGAPSDDSEARWEPKGWYNPSGSNSDITNQLTTQQQKNLFNKLRTWQVGIRMGVSGEVDNTLLGDNVAGYLESASQFYAADPSITASIYSQRQRAGYDRYNVPGRGTRGGWVNGKDAVFPTRTTFNYDLASEELELCWNGVMTGSADGYAIGNNTTFSNAPDERFGVAGAPPATSSPFSDLSPLPDSGSSKGRFLWSPSTSVGGHDATHKAFRVLRTPQRIFNHSNAITRKFVGFYYHFHSATPVASQLASRQEINGVEYYTTVWATQYNSTSTFANSYTNPDTGTSYNGLIHKQNAGLYQFVFVQPKPIFLGGITIDDVGSWFPSSPIETSYYTEFSERQHAPWKNKVLEIPSQAFDYVGTTRIFHNLNGMENTIQGVDASDGATTGNGLYIYIVTSPSKAGAESSTNVINGSTPETPVPCIANVQMAEYDQGLVPQSILDQLE